MGFVRCMGYGDGDLEETKTVTANGIVTPSTGYIAMKEVNVNLPMETLNATANGVYTPSSGNAGFSTVNVNVGVAGTDCDTLSINGNSAVGYSVSKTINIVNSGSLLMETYIFNDGTSHSSSQYPYIQIKVDKSLPNSQTTTLYNEIFSVTNLPHIGYSTGSGNNGFIPLVPVQAGDAITVSMTVIQRISSTWCTLYLIVYH